MLIYQSDNSVQADHVRIEQYTNFQFIQHLHKDLEFILVLSGEMEASVQGRKETIRAGQIALILSNQVHGFSTPVSSKALVVNVSVGYVGSFMRLTDTKTGTHSAYDASPALIALLEETYCGKNVPDTLTIKATAYAVCAQFLRHVPLADSSHGNDSVLHPLLQYVAKNYRENITMRTAAKAIGYDENYLSRYFHRVIDTNFRRYVNQYRVEYACQLLQGERSQLSEVALECGFQSIRSFNRAFLECMGMTPSEFRRHHVLQAEHSKPFG